LDARPYYPARLLTHIELGEFDVIASNLDLLQLNPTQIAIPADPLGDLVVSQAGAPASGRQSNPEPR
jgi:hypothetical protein